MLLDTRRGTYFALNNTGAAVWELLEEPRTLAELEAELVARFDIGLEALRSDLLELLTDMRQQGLIDEDR